MILGEQAGLGTGYSKKESQQKAAKEAFNKLQRDNNFRNHILQLYEKQQQLQNEVYVNMQDKAETEVETEAKTESEAVSEK